MDLPVKGNQDASSADFVWEEYLEDTNSKAAPPTAFTHVEHSLVSSFSIGMKLEVSNPEEESQYWVASVIMTCGPLLSLRYLGYGEDRSADFWFDVKVKEFHPVGWCNKNGKPLYPPKGVRDKHTDFQILLTSELENDTIPIALLSDPESCMTPIDQIKVGMIVEVADENNYGNLWPAKVIQNVGGRLLLRYEGSPATGETDFWLFYLSERLHPIGWAAEQELSCIPPEGKQIHLEEQKWAEVLRSLSDQAAKYPFPEHVLEPQLIIDDHGFEEGMKLEILNPVTLLDIHAATVIKVLDNRFFLVEVDSFGEDGFPCPSMCCHALMSIILPCGWAKENGLEIMCPDGYKGRFKENAFNWDEYLHICNAIPAPKDLFNLTHRKSELQIGMKLEAVNPFVPEEIHVATVQKVVEPLVWIRVDNSNSSSSTHAAAIDSFNLFPVGWCASNSYPLHTPVVSKHRIKIPTQVSSMEQKNDVGSMNKESGSKSLKDTTTMGKSWCPKIYFNHCCFTGPYLSKSRLAELPQAIGPGPVDLVMKDVLTRLINIAYKSSRVLRELQISGKPNPNMLQQTVKAKYKGKSYRATVEFIRNSEQVEDFCKEICRKLDCCPHLFGPNHVGKDCPDNCYSMTKTKFSYGFAKKKIVAPSSVAVGEDGLRRKPGPGRKKKRKHWRQLNSGTNTQMSTDNVETKPETTEEVAKSKEPTPQTSDANSATSDNEVPPVKRRRRKLASHLPKSEIVTRGAKLPNFGLDVRWRHHGSTNSFLPRKGRPPGRRNLIMSVLPIVKKKGRPLGSKRKVPIPSNDCVKQETRPVLNDNSNNIVPKEFQNLKVKTNPLEWSVDEVTEFIMGTSCAPVAQLLRDQEIDGQALLMLTMHNVQEFLHLKTNPARVLCSLIEQLKYRFFTEFI